MKGQYKEAMGYVSLISRSCQAGNKCFKYVCGSHSCHVILMLSFSSHLKMRKVSYYIQDALLVEHFKAEL